MSEPGTSERAEREKENLLRDFNVVCQLKDIHDTTELKERLMPKWWEAFIGIMQFGAALGLLTSILQYPGLRAMPLGRLLVFWLTLTVLSLIMGFEFVILRLHHLRRAYMIQTRRIESLEERLALQERHLNQARPRDVPAPSAVGVQADVQSD